MTDGLPDNPVLFRDLPPLDVTATQATERCRCGHHRAVHGGLDGLARCALRSCYCARFDRITSIDEIHRVSDWNDQ